MTLLLVRHAQSEGNAARMIQGWADVPLTDTGRVQAMAVGQRLARLPLDAVYASPLSRAHLTADAIASRAGLPVVHIPGLRERHYGEAQGLTWEQAAERWPARAAHDRDWADAVPGVESLPDLRRRAVEAVAALLDRHEHGLAACVSHGGTLSQVVAHLLDLPVGTWPRIRVPNTGVTVVEGPATRPLLRVLNDVCHLAGPHIPGGEDAGY